MPKIEFNFDELGEAAHAGFFFDAPDVTPEWSSLSAPEQEPWCQAGIAVVKLFAERVDELMAKIEADKAAGVRDEMGKSSEDIAEIALRDGVGCAIHGINADEIEDPELQQKWREAADLLKQIGRILAHAIAEDGYEYERPL